MASEQEQFETLLASLMTTDNDLRNQTETAYEALPASTKIPHLVQAIRNANVGVEVRQMAALLLRRLIIGSFDEFYPTLAPEIQAGMKEQLLLAVHEEQNDVVRKKVCDVVAELARSFIDEEGVNHWPESLKFLFDLVSSPNAALREAALLILSVTPGIFANQQQHYMDVIRQMLLQCLGDTENPQVRLAAVKATTAFLLAHDKEPGVQRHFVDCLPGLLSGVAQSIEKQEDDAALKCLIDLAESCPKFLRAQLEPLIELCLKVVGDATLADTWRHLALEVIVTMSETAPAMLRRHGRFVAALVPLVLALMVDLDDDDEDEDEDGGGAGTWACADDAVDDDADANAVAGESALDRLACGIGGKTVLPHVVGALPPMLQNPDWRYRHAALMAISAVGEGSHKQMEALLPNIMEGVLPFLQDPHPRVRYAACNAIGQMSTDFAPIFEKKFHDKVIPGLLMVMDDHANPRVQAHAGAALVNFAEDCPKTILAAYLDTIMSKLEFILTTKFKELVETGTKLVLEQVVTTIAAVADTCEEKFVCYYDRVMPCLKYIVQHAVTPELRMLRGKTIECVSLIGLAVGQEKFMQDASDVMQLLLKTQTEERDLPEDDPQISYMISAWARMCKILGKEFEQYLPIVMGPVMKAASLKPEVALLDSEDMKTMEDDDAWQFVTLGDQQNFGIRTAGLEEKATACQMLVCYARELKDGFAGYTEQVVKLMVPLLKFYFHDGVRVAATESLPFLLECAKIKGDDYLREMWAFICPELLKAVDTEPGNDVLSEHMHSLAKCIEVLGSGCLNAEAMAELITTMNKILKEHFERAEGRHQKRKDEDYDEEVEESLLDEDDEDVYILSKISDIVHALFGTHKADFFPYFEQLLPHFAKLMGAERPWPDHQWGLCIFDDALEHGGPPVIKYQEYFLRPLMQHIVNSHGEVRQAAAYGAGVMAQFAGPEFAQACAEAIPLLMQVIGAPDSRACENINPTENAIAAVTKICKYNSSRFNIDEVLPLWLSWLPVWEDEDEAPHIYGYLCDLIEANHPLILGANNSNVPRLVAIIADALAKEALDSKSEVRTRLLNIVRQIQGNGEMFNACVAQLSMEQQQALSCALSSQ